MLRDRLVCGIGDERIQRALLAEKALTYTKAFELCQSNESAERNAKALRTTTPGPQVVLATSVSGRRNEKPPQCYRCEGPHHPNSCRFKTSQCNYCRKKGHIAKACRSRKQSRGQPLQGHPQTATNDRGRRMNCLDNDAPDSHASADNETPPEALSLDYSMYKVAPDKVAPYQTSVTLNGAHLRMEIDTGAALSLISEATYERLWPREHAPPLTPTTIRLRTYTGRGWP